jgi:hypothetical protein
MFELGANTGRLSLTEGFAELVAPVLIFLSFDLAIDSPRILLVEEYELYLKPEVIMI